MMLCFSILKHSNEKGLLIFEQGKIETPMAFLEYKAVRDLLRELADDKDLLQEVKEISPETIRDLKKAI